MAKKILIVGGVAGGATFAARMRRLDERAQIILFEKGEYISFANCGLPYYAGRVIRDRNNLILMTPERFGTRYAIDVRTRSEVVSIDAEHKRVTVKTADRTYAETYEYLLLSPGSTPVRPPVPGIDDTRIKTVRSIPDIDSIKELIDRQDIHRAVVVGAGYVGLEMAENLKVRGKEVFLVELAKQVLLPFDKEMTTLLHQHIVMNGVRLILSDGVKEFLHNADDTVAVVLQSGVRLTADMVILAIGVKSDTDFLVNSGIAVTPQGAIITDTHMRANAEGIYAVGDAVAVTDFISGRQVQVPLAGPANRQGRIAADNIAGIPSEYKHTQGTAICKVFDLTAAITGLSEKNAKKYQIAYVKSYTHAAHHAGYYPGAHPLSMKILCAPETGKLLGAQVIGAMGADKRIDVLAAAIRHGLTVSDLSELELAYAPPYGSVRDPVNSAGFVAANILTGIMPVFYAEEAVSCDPQTQILLDVRTQAEFEQGALPGAIHIPVDALRSRLAQLDKNKEILVYCQVGLRGYVAARILLQNGFRARNLSGGYLTYIHTMQQ